jgi:hypothetical protein
VGGSGPRPPVGVIIDLSEVSMPVTDTQMFVKLHWFLRPIELARSPMKREHLELSLLIVRFPYLKTN